MKLVARKKEKKTKISIWQNGLMIVGSPIYRSDWA